jgi:hypothetical protein
MEGEEDARKEEEEDAGLFDHLQTFAGDADINEAAREEEEKITNLRNLRVKRESALRAVARKKLSPKKITAIRDANTAARSIARQRESASQIEWQRAADEEQRATRAENNRAERRQRALDRALLSDSEQKLFRDVLQLTPDQFAALDSFDQFDTTQRIARVPELLRKQVEEEVRALNAVPDWEQQLFRDALQLTPDKIASLNDDEFDDVYLVRVVHAPMLLKQAEEETRKEEEERRMKQEEARQQDAPDWQLKQVMDALQLTPDQIADMDSFEQCGVRAIIAEAPAFLKKRGEVDAGRREEERARCRERGGTGLDCPAHSALRCTDQLA